MSQPKYICSFSGGKDSTAMVHAMLERGENIIDVVYFDTGWEFPEMYDHIDLFEQKTGIKVTRLKPDKPLEHYLYKQVVENGKNTGGHGYFWPYAMSRWCTRIKTDFLKRHKKCFTQDHIQCIGMAADETRRVQRKTAKREGANYRYPLIEYGMTEQHCLEYCYKLGYTWNGLYEWNNRVSCFLCPMQSMTRLYQLYKRRPELYAEIERLNKLCVESLELDHSNGIRTHIHGPYFMNKMKLDDITANFKSRSTFPLLGEY